MHDERRSESTGRHAKAFLNMVDEEIALSLAMMTDAGEENLELVRFLDRKKVSTMDISYECQRFLERSTVLFERQGCLGCGLIAFMLRALEKKKLVFIDHRPKRVGGIAMDRIITRCFGRISKWVQLAREVLRAEFSQFETAQAVVALRLKMRHEQQELASIEAERSKQIEQLSKVAQMLELDVHDLLGQFFQHLPTAQFVCCRDGCASLVAWREAVDAADRRQYRKRQTAETQR
jgi:hypothetical protein